MTERQDQAAAGLSGVFLGNCGVLIQYKGHQLLCDGMYHDSGATPGTSNGISRIPADIYTRMLHRKDVFSNLEYLLFTHNHMDHCSVKDVENYCSKYPAKALFPAADRSGYIVKTDWFTLESIPTTHDMPSIFGSIAHCCYRLKIAGHTLLFTGDIDTKHEIPAALTEKPVDYLFYNIQHLLHSNGRAVAQEKIAPRHMFVQHIAFEEDDIFNLRKRIGTKLKRFGEQLPPTTPLLFPMQELPF